MQANLKLLNQEKTVKGTLTQAQLWKEVEKSAWTWPEEKQIINFWSSKPKKWASWDLLDQVPKFSEDNLSEEISQEFFTSLCTKNVKDFLNQKFQNWNVDLIDGHLNESIGSRKPDLVGYEKDTRDVLGIKFIVDIKKRGITATSKQKKQSYEDKPFSPQEKGQAVDFALALLRKQPWRQFVISGLTDGVRFVFYKVYVNQVLVSSTFKGKLGWIKFGSILCASDEELGYVKHQFPVGFTHIEFLGEGGSSYAFKSRMNDGKDVVLKVPKHSKNLENERSVLKELAEKKIEFVPRLVETGLKNILCEQPLGSTVQPAKSDGLLINQSHGCQLVKTLEKVHVNCEYVHRDIKPSNIFIANGNVLLKDWGSAAKSGVEVKPETTPLFAGNLINMSEEHHKPTANIDLVMLVRTLYVSWTRWSGPTDDENAENAWNTEMSGELWQEALQYARNCEYRKLEKWIERSGPRFSQT